MLALTRISHQLSTALTYLHASASLCSVGYPQRTVEYVSGSLGRMPRIHTQLRQLVTITDEKCGLRDFNSCFFQDPVQIIEGKITDFEPAFLLVLPGINPYLSAEMLSQLVFEIDDFRL